MVSFVIAGLPTGTIVFNVRRIGFEPASFTAVLHSGKTQRGTFRLTPSAQTLDTVSVTDTISTTHWLDQFARRREDARGTFFTRADIERRVLASERTSFALSPGFGWYPGATASDLRCS